MYLSFSLKNGHPSESPRWVSTIRLPAVLEPFWQRRKCFHLCLSKCTNCIFIYMHFSECINSNSYISTTHITLNYTNAICLFFSRKIYTHIYKAPILNLPLFKFQVIPDFSTSCRAVWIWYPWQENGSQRPQIQTCLLTKLLQYSSWWKPWSWHTWGNL